MTRAKQAYRLPRWRFAVICCALAALAATLMVRLVLLQVTDWGQGAVFLREQGALRTVRTAEIPVYRGLIEDRNGTPLAVSSPVVSLWANPQQLKDSPRLDNLAARLSLDAAALRDKLRFYGDKQFMYLARHQTPDFARQVLRENFPGVRGEREYRRYYTAGEVTAQLLGLTNVDGHGIAGVELAFEDWLQGVSGKKRFIKDLHGDAVRDFGVIEEPRPGKALALSLDLRLQYAQHRELQRAMKETGATAGSAITLDAWTGEVLAVSNYPVFNPNSRGALDFPLDIEVQDATARAIAAVEEAGGRISTVYYSRLALRALLKPDRILAKGRLLPRPVLPPPKLMRRYLDEEKRGYLVGLQPGDVLRPHEQPPHVRRRGGGGGGGGGAPREPSE